MSILRAVLLLVGSVLTTVMLNGCSLFTPTPPAIKLYVFQCGNIDVKDISLFSPGVDEGVEKKITDSCYLIQHPKGNMIWDTGLSDAMGEKGADAFGGKIHLNVTHPLADQLAQIHIKPDDIGILGLSHFHADHTGNANLFPHATLLIQEEEFNAAFGPEPQSYGFNPATYSKLDRNRINVLHGDYDVFGDGSVIIKKAPGHTPGHQVLFLNLPNYGPLVLSGDLYHFTSNREHRRVPSFNFNKEESLESMERIEAFVKEKHARFWIQHDLEQNQTIKHSPAYYD